MEQTLLTRGEMERSLSQYIQTFYRDRLGCRTRKVSCHILNDKVAIAIENSVTPVEKLFDNTSNDEFIQDLRIRIDAVIKDKLSQTMSEILQVEIVDMTINTTNTNSSHNFTGIIALLSEVPAFRKAKRASQV